MELNLKIKKIILISSWTILFTCGIVFYFYGITHEAIWYDESFTAAITDHSFIDIIKITSTDVHPPLYYFMLKIFKSFFGRYKIVLRSFSVIGAVALASLGFGPVRKILGNLIGFIFSFLIFIIPIFSAMVQEARMYTWACFFVTGCALFGYLAIKENTKIHWLLFCLLGLASCYTHNYGLLATGTIYSMIFIWLLFKDRLKIKRFIFCSIFLTAAYIPWLIILIRQLGVSKKIHVFIEPLNIKLIKSIFYYPFSNRFSINPGEAAIIFSLIIIIISFFGIIYGIIKKHEEIKIVILSFCCYIFTITGAAIYSLVHNPILYPKYTFILLGMLFISVAYGIGKLYNGKIIFFVCILILSISLPRIINIKKKIINGPIMDIKEFAEKRIEKNDIFIHTSPFIFGPFTYYFPHNRHLLFWDDSKYPVGGKEVFYPAGELKNDFRDFILNSKRVWLTGEPGYGYLPEEALMYYGRMKKKIDKKEFKIKGSAFERMNISLYEFDPQMKPGTINLGNLEVKVDNFHNNRGYLECLIYKRRQKFNPDDFLRFSVKNKITGNTTDFQFSDLPFGEYLIYVIHDENMNFIMDNNLKEGYGSNLVKIDSDNNKYKVNLFYP